MDHVVTGLLLGGIIASIYGVKKLRWKNHEEEDQPDTPRAKKQGILSRIIFGNK
jgi:hypothetical protein